MDTTNLPARAGPLARSVYPKVPPVVPLANMPPGHRELAILQAQVPLTPCILRRWSQHRRPLHVESGPLLPVVDRCRSTIIDRAYAEAQGQLGTPGADLTIDATTSVRCYQGQTTTVGS